MEDLNELKVRLSLAESANLTLQKRVEELDDFLENASIPLHWVDGDGMIVWANQAELNVLGYEKEEYVGHSITDFHADQKVILDILTRLTNDEILYDYPAMLCCKDGTIKQVLINSSVLRKDGKFVHTRCLTRDVTYAKQAEEKIGKLAAIVESSEDAIISKTLEGVITSWNRSAERLFGYLAEEMIGEPIIRLIPQDRLPEEINILSRVGKGERVEHFETRRLTKDHGEIDVSLTISPIKDAHGQIIGVSKIVRDISERKKDELRKSDFIGMVSHELKTPLTTLTALIQVLAVKLKQSEDKFVTGALLKASLQVKKMGTMINGFLNISRLESGKMLVEKQRFNLEELVEEIIAEASLSIINHEINFRAGDAVLIDADRDKIGAVISNLINNAVKYSPKGRLIQIRCTTTNSHALVSIQDDGMGVNHVDQGMLFDRYYRVESKQTQHISGFGIGLYLSAEIIHRHDGRIWVESESGNGSTFFFDLPLTVIN